MRIFSTLPIHSFSHPKSVLARLGFTLVELLISIAIIGIITSIVLVKYSSFDSTVLLKSLAYEIALSIREAQVKSVSVIGNGPNFSYPYGLTFIPNTKLYTAFRFEDSDPAVDPQYTTFPSTAASLPAVDILQVPIERAMEIRDVCITDTLGEDCNIDRLDVSFRRPEFKALFYADGYGGSMSNIISGKIKVGATNGGTNVFNIEVTSFGQILVCKVGSTPACT